MKRFIFLAFAFGIVLSITYHAEAAIERETIIGIWLLDEGDGDVAEDSSGNGHDGELVGGPKWIDGKFGDALQFSGSAQVKMPLLPEFDLETWSLVGWYKGEPTGDKWQGILGKPNTGSRNYACIYLNASGALRAEFTAGAGNWRAVNGTTNIGDDNWHHIAGTYDGERLKCWVDGVVEGQMAESGKPSVQVDQPFSIGTSGGHKCNGIVDDVGLFKVGLEEGDIKRVMELGLAEALQAAVSSQDKLAVIWGELKSR